MSKRHRPRRARPNPPPAAMTPEARWDYRSGVTSSSRILDGSKFKGGLLYPSAADLDYSALRLRSRLASWESAQAQGLLRRLVDNTVGSGLTLQSVPLWDLIDHPRLKTDEAREAWTRQVELRFHLWANSPEVSADYSRNLYEIQALAFINALRDGEYSGILRYNERRDRISPLSIQHIDAEQIVTPPGKMIESDARVRGNRVKDGVEVNAYGEMQALHIAEDPLTPTKTTRVPAWGGGGSGRRWIVRAVISDLIGAVRGTPILAPLVHELQKITDYTVAELEATVNNAVILGYVTTDVDGEKRAPLTGVQARSTAASAETATSTSEPKKATIDGAGIWLQSLGKGQDLKTLDTRHPNSSFDGFVKSVTKTLSAALSIPIEVLEESFNANYSASRASLILFWKTVIRWRDFLVSQFLRPVYEAWFAEEVRADRIKDVVGWDDPILRAAWLNATWDGDSLPSIDPLKDATADDVRIAQGATTREQVARKYNGSDYRANVQRLAEENALLREATPEPAAPTAPAPTAPEGDDK